METPTQQPLESASITIPLRWWLDLTTRCRGNDYTVINLDLAAQIAQVDPDGRICYIENSSATLNYSGDPMPQLDNNLVRCWDAVSYRRSYDHHIKLKETSDRERDERVSELAHVATMRLDLTNDFIAKGVPALMAKPIVNGMTIETLRIAWAQLQPSTKIT